MLNYLVAYISAAIIFCLMDFVWLTIIAKNFYQARLGALMLAEPKVIPAAAFYILYLVGLLVLAIIPALKIQNWFAAMSTSAFIGLIAYASYDLTNLATLKGWSTSLALVDIGWGVVVSAVSGTAGYFAVRLFEKL